MLLRTLPSCLNVRTVACCRCQSRFVVNPACLPFCCLRSQRAPPQSPSHACRGSSAQQPSTGQSQASAATLTMCSTRLEVHRQGEPIRVFVLVDAGARWLKSALRTCTQRDHLIKRLKALRDSSNVHEPSSEQEGLDGSFDIIDEDETEEAAVAHHSLPGSFEQASPTSTLRAAHSIAPSRTSTADEFGALSAGAFGFHRLLALQVAWMFNRPGLTISFALLCLDRRRNNNEIFKLEGQARFCVRWCQQSCIYFSLVKLWISIVNSH